MKPFNLEQALAGAPVMTRDGRKVLHIFYAGEAYENSQVICVLDDGAVFLYYRDGTYISYTYSLNDLFMVPQNER